MAGKILRGAGAVIMATVAALGATGCVASKPEIIHAAQDSVTTLVDDYVSLSDSVISKKEVTDYSHLSARMKRDVMNAVKSDNFSSTYSRAFPTKITDSIDVLAVYMPGAKPVIIADLSDAATALARVDRARDSMVRGSRCVVAFHTVADVLSARNNDAVAADIIGIASGEVSKRDTVCRVDVMEQFTPYSLGPNRKVG